MSGYDQEQILVIKLGALGDFIQALGPMAAIRRHHPEARITLLTTDPFVNFANQCGYIDRVWTDDRPRWKNPRGWLELREKLNNGHFTRVYDLQNNDRTALYFKLFSPKPEWVGTARGASHRNTAPERTAGLAFYGHKQTLALAGIDDVEIDDLSWIEGDAGAFNLQNPYVLLVPGSAPDRPEKQWGAKNYGLLARMLYGWGYTPVILGTNSESEIARTICDIFPDAVDLTGQTALTDIVLLARGASAAIGNDTGPMHLIAPTGCPSFVLFSRHSDPARHAPLGPTVKTIQVQNLSGLSADELIGQLSARDFRDGPYARGSSSGQ